MAGSNRNSPARTRGRGRAAQTFQDDPPAVAAFRRGDNPTDRVRVPKAQNMNAVGQHVGGKAILATMLSIARETGTFIVPDRVSARDNRDTMLWKLWGSETAVKEAKVKINNAFNTTTSKSHGAKWAKVANLTLDERNELDRELDFAASSQIYKQLVIPGGEDSYHFSEEIPWTRPDLPIQKLFGRSLEAFDRIRQESEVFIVPARTLSNPGVFVVGNDENRFRKAVDRVKIAFKQAITRSFIPPQYFLIKISSQNVLTENVRLSSYFEPSMLGSARPALLGATVKFDGPKLESSVTTERQISAITGNLDHVKAEDFGVGKLNLVTLESVTMTMLDRLRWWSGNMRMRAKLGTLVVTKYRKPVNNCYKLEEFEEMLTDYNNGESGAELTLTEELGHKNNEVHLLSRFLEARDVLLPCGSFAEELSGFKPSHSWILVLGNSDQEAGDYRLEIQCEEGLGPNDIKVMSKKWERLELGEDNPFLMEINFADLEGGLSYQLIINTARPVDETQLASHYVQFADSLKPQLSPEMASNMIHPSLGADWYRLPPSAIPKSTCHRRSWLFKFKDSDYHVEVASIQNLVRTTLPGGKNKWVSYEMRWTVSLFLPIWDTNLGGNSRLALGKRADWIFEEPSFFPAFGKFRDSRAEEDKINYKGDGFLELVRHLQMTEAIVMRGELGADRLAITSKETSPDRKLEDVVSLMDAL